MALDKNGHEVLDDTPIALPMGFGRPPSLQEQIRQMVRIEHLKMVDAGHDVESPEEADDFDVGDDYDPSSPWEYDFNPPSESPPGDERANQNSAVASPQAAEQPSSPTPSE